ncbi:MAG: phage replisome organizer N-terminal domain-containing protein [Ruminococcus sp.]|uniref:phage replisome organizer N-terminal domain-containing protein n=1 Tax=Ruminococcus sp. TaxID=41978 RepID=UPI0039913229
MQNKRYYWLKLKNDFFEGDEINWLEEQENGAVYILFYLKLCLRSLRSDGVLMRRVGKMEIPYDTKKLAEITGTPLPAAETAMALLTSAGLVEVQENGALFMPQMEDMTGSETERAAIMRKYRTPKTEKENHSEDSDREIEVQSSNHNVITMLPEPNHNVITSLPETDHIVDTEIEKELESELESETEPEKESDADTESLLYPERDGAPETRTTTAAQAGKGNFSGKRLDKAAQWVKPEPEEIAAYCAERQNGIDPEQFYDYYEANGWRMGQNPMRSWKAAVRTWERKKAGSSGENTPEPAPTTKPVAPETPSSVYASFICNPC